MIATEFLFAYGSNMDLAQMKERCPNSRDKFQPFVAQAVGWKLCFPRFSERRQGGVGSMVRAVGEVVWGVVFALAPEDLPRLDAAEGVPHAYRRDPLSVTWGNALQKEVWTYFAIPQDNPSKHYIPHQDYLAIYVRGAESFKLPADYLDRLKKIETLKRQK